MSETRIFQQLRADHSQVLANLEALDERLAEQRGRGAPGLPAGFVEFAREFSERLGMQFDTHLAAEDEVLYPALAERIAQGNTLLGPLYAEHTELRAMLGALVATLDRPAGPERDEQIVVQLRDLVDLLRIHIRKEEAVVFGVAERILKPCDLVELESRRARWHPSSPTTTSSTPTPFEKGKS